jgi:hypothetical protein
MLFTLRSWRSRAWTRRRSSSGGMSRAPLKKRSKSTRSCRISPASWSIDSDTVGAPGVLAGSDFPGGP